jgi:transcriptional regulator with XRE-family HTH domain
VKVDDLKDAAKAKAQSAMVQRPTVSTIGEFIREQREQAQVSLRQLSKLAGVSNPYLSQVERGLRRPSAEILQQIAKGLRISAEQLYVHAGILDARSDPGELVARILADSHLTERQKSVLVDIYSAFRRENALRQDSESESDRSSSSEDGPALGSAVQAADPSQANEAEQSHEGMVQ